jgi:glyoxylase-like metal-dependent hydrolase (beta-lactamase superfamily II)
VWLIRGGFLPNRQPDGNTIIFQGPKGLTVMDTGRHRWQRQAILDFADSLHQPIVAIINSHWHLDHVSGNPDLKRAYPAAKVYASDAIDGALKGFLPKSAVEGRKYLEAGQLPPETLEDLKNDLATIDSGAKLRPDVVVKKSGTLKLGGLDLRVNLAPDAATDGDLWVFDPVSKVIAMGDLVTLPAPFLDTGCPSGWKAGLEAILATPFQTAIPGHGAPMTRAEVTTYRDAFTAFIDCSASTRPATECGSDWAKAISSLVGGNERLLKRAEGMASYYAGDVLRANGGKSPSCRKA